MEQNKMTNTHLFNSRISMNEFYANNRRLSENLMKSKDLTKLKLKIDINKAKHIISLNPSMDAMEIAKVSQNSPENKDITIQTKYNMPKEDKKNIKQNPMLDNSETKDKTDKKLASKRTKLIDETLIGSFDLSSDLKAKFRRYKSRYWAGVRVPMDQDYFRKQRDEITRWNESLKGRNLL